ncbi:MAG TPA: threonine synthase [Verrucomicrobiota bacterium]|nr:threonine synthase [Verrucomicrobiota bacterium]HNT13934.1 threonine synthase [Verrucomicrobiota bacterium]
MAALLFHSTNGRSPAVDLRSAVLHGLAPDRGLYLPETFPQLTRAEIAAFTALPYAEIAFRVLAQYTRDVVPDATLAAMCQAAYDFEVPLEKIGDRVHLMRLDQGPTASFKDFAAQMMSRLMGFFLRQDGRQLIILTATSGDTGSAVAHAFHNIPGIRVLVLFPFAEVSVSQRKLMTTLAGNIRTIAIDGKFDDCQAMVKRAFADPALKSLPLSSANSINIGRLLPQSVYYFYAASRLAPAGEPMVFSIPSGNFGDMMGAIVAREMGLPVKKIIASVNDNDAFPRYLATGHYAKIVPSRNSLSNAMNVGHPSNLARLIAVYGGQMDEAGTIHRAPDLARMRRDLFSSSVSDARTRAAFLDFWHKHQLLLEPHGAVAWQGFQDWLQTEALEGRPAVILETANPAKFPEEIQKAFGWSPDVPPRMAAQIQLAEDFDRLTPDYDQFRDYLIGHYADHPTAKTHP